MTRFLTVALSLGAALAADCVVAETLYVTDELQLGLYPTASAVGQPSRVLPSGTALEVLDRVPNFAHVRTSQGTEGWVKSAFLVAEEPARTRLIQLEQRNLSLTENLSVARSSLQNANAQITDLESSMASADQRLEGLQNLETENQVLRKRLDKYGFRVSLPWLLLATAAALTLGFLGGVRWLDRRVRRRFGGVRIY